MGRPLHPAGQRAWAGGRVRARRSAEALARVGFGVWPLAAALAAAGLVTFWRARLRVVPIAVGLLAAELLVAGAAHRYPFLEERTSIFSPRCSLSVGRWRSARWRPGVSGAR